MKLGNILTFALVGILLTVFVVPNVFAASPQYYYAQSSRIQSDGSGIWLLNEDESMNVHRSDTPFYTNVYDNECSSAGDLYLIRLSSTVPVAGLDPSLTYVQEDGGTLSPGSQRSLTRQVTISSSASIGTTYTMSTSHYYAMGHYPGTQYYPPTSAVKHFTVTS